MELDDLKTRWLDLDRKLDASVLMNARATRAVVRTEDALRRHARVLVLELVLDAIALLLTGSFIGNHLGEPQFLVPAIVLHLGLIVLAIPLIRQLVLMRELDYAAPVVSIQRTVERLHIEEIRALRWTLAAAPLLWTPLLIVAMKAFLGLDAWAIFSMRWIAANLVFGVVFLGAMVWASRHFGPRIQTSRFLRRAMDGLAGRSLRSARRFLDDLAEFEKT